MSVKTVMHRSAIILPLVLVALVLVSATTRPGDDPARRLAGELREYLKEARVQSVEFRLNRETEPRLRLSERDGIAGMVKSFVDALAADDLREGKQRHRPPRNVHIRFVIEDGPDVRLNYVGHDMFWAAMSDEEPQNWVNLQTPALTQCFAEQLKQLPARSPPASATPATRPAADLEADLKRLRDHDPKERASPAVMESARRVFDGLSFVGLTGDEVRERLGPAHSEERIAGLAGALRGLMERRHGERRQGMARRSAARRANDR